MPNKKKGRWKTERKVGKATVMIAVLLMGMALMAAPTVKAVGTVYIRADGSIDPPTAPIQRDGDIYTFTDNIYDSIVIERSNIIIDGAGYTLQGAESGRGFYWEGINNVTIKNTNIKGFYYGIYFWDSSNNIISGNSITANNRDGIHLEYSSNNSISGNSIANNGYDGIYLYDSSNNIISGNNITANNRDGIHLWYSSNNSISGNSITANNEDGIHLYSSNNNIISGNNIANNWDGIYLDYSSNNIISGNSITANNGYGIYLWDSSNNNIISGNNITNNRDGIRIEYSSNNIISGNNITNYGFGIRLDYSSNNIIGGNNITNNEYGIYLYDSSNNSIYHNNFINNTLQAYSIYSTNVWDDGYPSGGNYWSDYAGVDLYSGPEQSELGSDGIGDAPYGIDADNKDHYPLMASFSTFDAGTWNGTAYNVDVISNSTVSNFQLDASQKTISFNVTGSEFTAGFCRVAIPNIIVQDLWQGNYTVLLNGKPWPFRNWTDPTNTYIYINYTHSEHQITIIPEFPSALIPSLFMPTTLIATALLKKKRKTKTQLP